MNEEQNINDSTNTGILPMPCYAQPGIELYNCDNMDLLRTIADGSIDVICTDPPYLYLKGQKLERPFDEKLFFLECKRVLKKGGFIVLFGRGTSFYRWNTILADLGFEFKEEIIWNKSYTTSSMHPISRTHEQLSINSVSKAKLNAVRVPYIEIKSGNMASIQQDLKRIKSALNNPKELAFLEAYLLNGEVDFGEDKKRGYNTTIQGVSKEQCRSVKTLQAITEGMKERSVINIKPEHFDTIHPTQKPVRLLERLLALVIPDKPKNKIVVADFFGGSFSAMEAVYNMGMKGISCEIDKEYFEAGKKRIESLPPRQTYLFD